MWATAPESESNNYWSLWALETMLCNKGGHFNERPECCHREWPLLSTARERKPTWQWRLSTAPHQKKIMIEGYPFCIWDAYKILTPFLSAGYSDVLSLWKMSWTPTICELICMYIMLHFLGLSSSVFPLPRDNFCNQFLKSFLSYFKHIKVYIFKNIYIIIYILFILFICVCVWVCV